MTPSPVAEAKYQAHLPDYPNFLVDDVAWALDPVAVLMNAVRHCNAYPIVYLTVIVTPSYATPCNGLVSADLKFV